MNYIPSDVRSKTDSFLNYVIIIVLPVIFLSGTILLVIIEFRKYRKNISSHIDTHHLSFIRYIKSKNLFNRTSNKKKNTVLSDEVLEKIEEILKENEFKD